MLSLVAIFMICVVLVETKDKTPSDFPDFGLLSDEEIEYINTDARTTWTAGRNFHHEDHHYVKRLLGSELSKNSTQIHIQVAIKKFNDSIKMEDLPVNFDARSHWPHCPSLWDVRDQGDCGACWAFAAVESMTDRLCIKTRGKRKFYFSAEHVLSCCENCGKGCHGGYTSRAWDFYRDKGIVSGGPYNSSEGCQPYRIPACDHHVKGRLQPCTQIEKQTPICRKKCIPGYHKKLHQDKRYGKNTYTVKGEVNIMRELVTEGPVEASFKIYSDFFHYKSGVYQHVAGPEPHGGHAVKLIGYGVENGTKYWLLTNSWNPDWGDGGFFKILRGVNECEIEQHIFAGDPRL